VSDLATYDYQGLGIILRDRLIADGRGWRVCAKEIGVTAPDLARITNGQPVSAPKVIAVCDWLGLSFRGFYRPPDHLAAADAAPCDTECFTGTALKQPGDQPW
jgi:hypothetical protein